MKQPSKIPSTWLGRNRQHLTLSVNSPVKPTDAAEIDSLPFSGAFENERRPKLQKTFHGMSQIAADMRRICMETTFLPTSPSRTLSCMVFALSAITVG